jgi:hypothetical protein
MSISEALNHAYVSKEAREKGTLKEQHMIVAIV